MYKYRCRDCRVQAACIEQSDTSPAAKEMIRRAFAARTDTMSTWAVLQKRCLLVLEDEERERRAKEGSLLGRRLREARAATEQNQTAGGEASVTADDPASRAEEAGRPDSRILGRPEPASRGTEELNQGAVVSAMISDPEQTGPVEFETKATRELANKPVGPEILVEPEEQAQLESRTPATQILGTQILDRAPALAEAEDIYWLIVANGRRRIALPGEGELILGRFDPSLDKPLDVDLTFEDQQTLSVSRRHARVSVQQGRHLLEDLGSSNGTTVNGAALAPGQAHPLAPGDRIKLGELELGYQPAQPEFYASFMAGAVEARQLLLITHVGVKLDIKPPGEVIIGRTDPDMQIYPTLDLSPHGDLAVMVSRRHATLTWRGHLPYIQDLNSSFGTRLNGRRLDPQQVAALKPGDQISLGGCVLAYDVEL
jgi:pSer/pThr/pTyr-binding forkhead associated (FHA) protein